MESTKEIITDPKIGLSYFWSIVAAALLFYITIKFGSKMEILTLVIGIVGGTILGGIFGLWFGATHNNKNNGSVNEINTDIKSGDEVTIKKSEE